MVVIACDAENCTFKTQDLSSEELLLKLISNHREDRHVGLGHTTTNIDRAARPEKPVITANMTPLQWANTEKYWTLYKKASRISSESDRTTHLLTCCDQELRDQLFSIHDDIFEMNEVNMLKIIKNMAVKSESVIVAQVNLVRSRQNAEEPIRSYYARLKGQAVICDYTVTKQIEGHDHTISYTEPMLKQIIASNMADPEIQVELLSHLNSTTTPMTADNMVTFIEARENSKRSSIKLSTIHSSSPISSTYKRSSRPLANNPHQSTQQRYNPPQSGKERCSYCNRHGHGNHWGLQGAQIRKRLGCPAFGKKCNKCYMFNHFEFVCKSTTHPRQSSAAVESTDQEEVIIGGAINIRQE